MAKLLNAIYLTAFFIIINALQSCWFNCNCTDDTLYFSLNTAETENIDNSSTYPFNTEIDVMHAAAVAFRITLRDSSETDYNFYYATILEKNRPRAGFGIQHANAWSCDCPIYFMPSETVTRFEIITTFDINQQLRAGEDVSNFFLAETRNFPMDGLYATIDEVISFLYASPTVYATVDFNIFLQPRVENTIAEFTINVYLSNGKVLTAKTDNISIVD